MKETVKEVFSAVVPITVLVTILQLTVAKLPTNVFINFIGGAVLVILGLTLFLIGAKVGFLPVGEMVGSSLVTKGKLWLILFFGFVIGSAVTVAEPDVQVLAGQVDSVSGGAISKFIIVTAVACGVGIFVSLALLRIFLRIPINYLLVIGYALVFLLALVTSPEFVAVSFDAGGVTTGPMTVPFILALGVGVASVTGKRTSSSDSFGLIALASIGPILAVLLLGVFYK
ncbi:DUF1538 domain-containing protein [Thermosediminibacter litoriperuensis]|uniref:Uncharacterized protein DUF1538 n=1 Tax=Thermosediminibacter litoriperuensis TaxID=291989 RepID=A0A5S5AWV3_9FIRM|nr:DUF1538 domain-containing protein [Thermosediminibacter litoriperuensis]TYP56113.1 uncharacterized protein DUF1538 [Thermosediminibacter litoriperuensis]